MKNSIKLTFLLTSFLSTIAPSNSNEDLESYQDSKNATRIIQRKESKKKTVEFEDQAWKGFLESKKDILSYVSSISRTKKEEALWFLTTGGKFGFRKTVATPTEEKIIRQCFKDVSDAFFDETTVYLADQIAVCAKSPTFNTVMVSCFLNTMINGHGYFCGIEAIQQCVEKINNPFFGQFLSRVLNTKTTDILSYYGNHLIQENESQQLQIKRFWQFSTENPHPFITDILESHAITFRNIIGTRLNPLINSIKHSESTLLEIKQLEYKLIQEIREAGRNFIKILDLAQTLNTPRIMAALLQTPVGSMLVQTVNETEPHRKTLKDFFVN